MGVTIYLSHLISDRELAELTRCYHCGLESIEFSIGHELDHFEASMEQYRQRLTDMGSPRLTLHGPFLDLNPAAYDSLIRRVTRERFEACYRAGQLLGAEKIVFHSCFVPQVYYLTGWAERIIEFFEEFLDGKQGIGICLENVLDPEIAPIRQIAETISHPDFGLCLDVGHAHCYSKHSVTVWAEELAPWIRHLHLHDNDGSGDQHQALGRGNIPFEQILAVFLEQVSRQKGSFPTITLELNSAQDIIDSMHYLSQLEGK